MNRRPLGLTANRSDLDGLKLGEAGADLFDLGPALLVLAANVLGGGEDLRHRVVGFLDFGLGRFAGCQQLVEGGGFLLGFGHGLLLLLRFGLGGPLRG